MKRCWCIAHFATSSKKVHTKFNHKNWIQTSHSYFYCVFLFVSRGLCGFCRLPHCPHVRHFNFVSRMRHNIRKKDYIFPFNWIWSAIEILSLSNIDWITQNIVTQAIKATKDYYNNVPLPWTAAYFKCKCNAMQCFVIIISGAFNRPRPSHNMMVMVSHISSSRLQA